MNAEFMIASFAECFVYLARDCKHGHDVEDWLQAERELQLDPEC